MTASQFAYLDTFKNNWFSLLLSAEIAKNLDATQLIKLKFLLRIIDFYEIKKKYFLNYISFLHSIFTSK